MSGSLEAATRGVRKSLIEFDIKPDVAASDTYVNLTTRVSEQPLEVCCKKKVFLEISQIRSKTPVPETLF